MSDVSLAQDLPPPWRLALAYAPAPARAPWRALLTLDWRLGQTVRQSREPLLAQIRLAWWRDRLNQAPDQWPAGEPTLAALLSWGQSADSLVALVNGWEAMLEDPPKPELLAQGRGAAMAALAELLGEPAAAAASAKAGFEWSHVEAGESRDSQLTALPRVMRPLSILWACEQYRSRPGAAFLKILSIGLLGR